MSVRLELDDPRAVYTCLDRLNGKVVFTIGVGSQETVSSITVKMEGISRTRLLVPEHDRESRTKAELEIHKVLYQAQTVFPATAIAEQQNGSPSTSHAGYTLAPGTYTYPFTFRIPLNNSCRPADSLFSKINVTSEFGKGVNIDYAKDPTHHEKATLPPSLFGIPGGADGEGGSIRYFLKVTVNRPQFYRKNIRRDIAFVFLPIEPPRLPNLGGETYARRQHKFNLPPVTLITTPAPKKKGLWNFGSHSKPTQTFVPNEPTYEPRFTLEARLPCPSILTPKEPMGLRIILVKLEPFTSPVLLRQVQIRLLVSTHIRAHKQFRKYFSIIPLFNASTGFRAGMHPPFIFGNENTPVGQEIEADRSIWADWTLPETIGPSFKTCNITTSYQLEITCGVSLGEGPVDQIPLVIPIEVYSGIKPPEKLLQAVKALPSLPQTINPTPRHSRTLSANDINVASSSAERPRPRSSTTMPGPSSSSVPEQTTQSRNSLAVPTSPTPLLNAAANKSEVWLQQQFPADAPPTYEDAILLDENMDIGVSDGPRNRDRQYPMQEGYFSGISEMELVQDEKRAQGTDYL